MTARTAAAAALLVALPVGLAGCGRPSPTPAPPAPTNTSATATGTPTGAPVAVVGLGDSVMAGSACGCQPFIARYAAALGARAHTTARVTNLGRPGLTVPALGSQLDTSAVRQVVGSADVVVVTIGANDLVPLVDRWRSGGCGTSCVDDAAAQLADPLDRVLTELDSEAPRRARVLVTDYWNVFEDGDVADDDFGPGFASWSDEVTAAANEQICGAARRIHATCVDLREPFGSGGGSSAEDPTPLLAGDGDHPNSAGHALIARTLLAATPADSP